MKQLSCASWIVRLLALLKGDRGYPIAEWVKRYRSSYKKNHRNRGVEAVILSWSNRRVKIEPDRAPYKKRNRTERMFCHLKINCAIATRCGPLANSFLRMVHIAAARYGSN